MSDVLRQRWTYWSEMDFIINRIRPKTRSSTAGSPVNPKTEPSHLYHSMELRNEPLKNGNSAQDQEITEYYESDRKFVMYYLFYLCEMKERKHTQNANNLMLVHSN